MSRATIPLTIRPDPDRPSCGFAVVSMPSGGTMPETVPVAVLETFGGRWLAPSAGDASGQIGIGDRNWQPVALGFGPYRVRLVADRAEVTLGPEIVNKIGGYTSLRLIVGGQDGLIT